MKSMYVQSLYIMYCVVQEAKMTDEDRAVLADEALSSPDFVSDMRKEFLEHLNTLKALTAHGPV